MPLVRVLRLLKLARMLRVLRMGRITSRLAAAGSRCMRVCDFVWRRCVACLCGVGKMLEEASCCVVADLASCGMGLFSEDFILIPPV